MVTSIQISEKLQNELAKRKLFVRETYEEVIWDLIEDTQELSKETQENIKEAQQEILEGKFITLSDIKKKYGMR